MPCHLVHSFSVGTGPRGLLVILVITQSIVGFFTRSFQSAQTGTRLAGVEMNGVHPLVGRYALHTKLLVNEGKNTFHAPPSPNAR